MKTAQTHRKRKKGQAALEFLTTYGWAFLIVLVMIGALSYFGVLDPSRLLPDKCIFAAGMGCTDYVGRVLPASQSRVNAQLVNGFGYSIILSKVEVTCSGISTGGCTQCAAGAVNNYCHLMNSTEWRADDMKEFVVLISNLKSSDKPRIEVEIVYMKGGSTYSKNITGVIQVRPN
ncbi:MAG: hypothetical protein ABIJ21_05225 [Nanoarchaeota archaeon]